MNDFEKELKEVFKIANELLPSITQGEVIDPVIKEWKIRNLIVKLVSLGCKYENG